MTLAELQQAFQAAILDRSEVPGSILASHQQTAGERFAVYQNAYQLRLTEFLVNDFPVLYALLGDEGFGALAQDYIEANPSSHRNARWYARDLPDFMRTHASWKAIKAAAGLALFERTLADAFDAADADARGAEALADIAAEDHPLLYFTFQPSLALLTLVQGTIAAYEAASQDLEVPAPSTNGEERVLVWRDRSLQSYYRILDEDEALALDCASSGGTFAEMCGLLSLRVPEAEVANQAACFLIRWFTDGLIAGLTVRQD